MKASTSWSSEDIIGRRITILVLRVGPAMFRGVTDTKHLRDGGISSEYVETGLGALELLRLYDYDLILTDQHLPDILGYELVRKARSAGLLTPAIILAVGTTVEEVVNALNDGADDFIRLPADPGEILARMRAVARRCHGHDASNLQSGTAELSLDHHDVHVKGKKLSLTTKEFAVMELLFMKQRTLVSKEALLNHLYTGVEEPELKTIDVLICRLRKKLVAAGAPALIETVWGCGYTLNDSTNTTDDLVSMSI